MRRLTLFLALVVTTAAGLLALASPASAASLATTTTLQLDKTTVALNDTVTMTATVTAASGTVGPSGSVVFQAIASDGTVSTIGTSMLQMSGPGVSTSAASMSSSALAGGNYQIVANYGGAFQAYKTSSSTPVSLSVAGATIHNTVTQLTADHATITAGDTVTFTAHLAETDGPIVPTGTVTFTSLVGGQQSILGQGELNANGDATFSIGGWQAGTYTVVAQYIGDILDHSSSAQISFGVNPSAPQALVTTTTVGLDPSSIQTNTTVNITATVVQSRAGAIPPAGDHVTFFATATGSSQPVFIGQGDVTWDTSSGTGPFTGTAHITVSGWVAGFYTVAADFIGDISDLASSGVSTLAVTNQSATTLPYTGDVTGIAGSPANVAFRLLDANGVPAASEPVTITINGQDYPATTRADGTAAISVALPSGTYPIVASFTGDSAYLASAGNGLLVISKRPSVLTYTGDTSVTAGANAQISFALTDGLSGALVPNEQVSVTIDGQTQTLTSDANGIVSFSVTKPGGTYPVSASFGGDGTYAASSGAGSLTVNKIPTATTYTGDTQSGVGKTATLSATLVDASGNPLSGKSVTLSFGSVHCTAVTNASGVASCTVTVVDAPGTYAITASFAGDGSYLPSSGPGSIVVTGQAVTAIVDNVSGNFLQGSSLTLSGKLTVNGAALAGKPVTLTFGSASCIATSDANGVASCSIVVPGPTGPTTTKASFAGDLAYKPAADTKPALVYAFAPGGGNFVVGDQSATGSVYFWGSQWWKVNDLSSGDAQSVDPASFKGFAASPAIPQCGGTWTTLPGNSTPPPAAPLPAYMAVIVTSTNHKAPGKIISGNVVHIVIVKTDSGYEGNPGHAGTGTVVATVC